MEVVVGESGSLKLDEIQARLNKLGRYLTTLQGRIVKKQHNLEGLIANMSPKERALLQQGLKLHQLDAHGENV